MSCKDKNNSGCCTNDLGRGCDFCNCNNEASATACEGCYKLHTTDWLEEMPNVFPTDIFEVRFKNTRKSFFKNVNNLPLQRGDVVAVEASPGHDIGIVSMTGDMVARQMKRVGFSPLNGEFKKVYRKAKPYDIEKWQEAIAMEHETMIHARQLASDMKLNMKIGDVEYQGDKIKAIFYYIADERVDFRELIKVFADQFRIRVEMKQIGARQEAGRIGGLGSCGRELCCASWISSFVSVTTNSARAQEISLNPQKLAGQCGKLKCCLVYELDTYLDARKEYPRINQPLQALDGEYYLVKTDILGRTMSFSTSPHSMAGFITLPLARVKEIIELNRKGKKVERMMDETEEDTKAEEPTFVNMVGEDSITRFDKKKAERVRGGRDRGRTRTTGDGEGGGETTPEGGEKRQSTGGGRRDQNGRRSEGGSRENRPPREPRAGGQPRENRPPREPRADGQPREPRENRPPREPRVNSEAANNGTPSGEGENKSGGNGENRNRNNRNRNRNRGEGGNREGGNRENRSRNGGEGESRQPQNKPENKE